MSTTDAAFLTVLDAYLTATTVEDAEALALALHTMTAPRDGEHDDPE